jgi:hypothetical protein
MEPMGDEQPLESREPQEPREPQESYQPQESQEQSPESLDERFDAILARWDDEAPTSGSARLEGLDLTFRHRPGPLDDPGQRASSAPNDGAVPPDDGVGTVWRGYTPAEVEEHFEPPDPVLPPAHDATYWLALAGLVFGPLIVVWAAVISGNPDPGWWVLIGILATIGGFGLMVMRGSGERDPHDDGAIV